MLLLANKSRASLRRQEQQGMFDLHHRVVKTVNRWRAKEDEDQDLPPSLLPSCYACTSPLQTSSPPPPPPIRVS